MGVQCQLFEENGMKMNFFVLILVTVFWYTTHLKNGIIMHILGRDPGRSRPVYDPI